MDEWVVGYAIGMVVGFTIGFLGARRQKRWEELTTRERKLRIVIIAVGVVLLLAGIVVAVTYD